MKKFYLLLASLLILGGIKYFPSKDKVETKIVELHITRADDEQKILESYPKTAIRKMPLRHSVCSGAFVTNDGAILTAKHCTEGADHIDVITSDQEVYTGIVIQQGVVHDLAVIRIAKRHTPYFRLASSLERGETIFALGSPLAITNTLSTGIVAKMAGDIILIDCSALPGNSGCPLFNKRGELVGVVTAGFWVGMGTTHLNLAQSLDAVKFFLSELR